MRVVRLAVRRFRGIRELSWDPPGGLTCLVGPGDSAKTTILEAIELALAPRGWVQFVDSDYFEGTTTHPIEVEVTLADAPAQLLTEEKFGLEVRGWSPSGQLHDEPEDDDEVALTIRLSVDEALEPSWHVINNRNPEGRQISARDRETLGAFRLGDEADRHLSWVRGSALGRLTEAPDSISSAVSHAHRTARDAVAETTFPQLSDAARKAGELGALYGSQVALPLGVGVDPRQLNVGSGALSLRQASGIPARSSGLGSRRLLALGVQHEGVGSGLTLVDEIEYGLEPHRLRHLLQKLRATPGQAIITSHSETAVAELGVSGLGVVRRTDQGTVSIVHPALSLQAIVRGLPEAILARRIIVCEGRTEHGLARGLVRHWDLSSEYPLAYVGTVFADGNGSQASAGAIDFQKLGFEVILWADSDRPLNPPVEALPPLGIPTIHWAGNTNTESRIMLDVPEATLEELWALAILERGEDTVSTQLAITLGMPSAHPSDFAGWKAEMALDKLRVALGKTAAARNWFKSITVGEQVGEIIAPVLNSIASTDLATKLTTVRTHAYAD